MHATHAGQSVPALTREQCRAVDRYAIEELAIPGVVLMENAGRNAADLIAGWMAERRAAMADTAAEPMNGRVCIVCGRGNNGGDGFVIARHLAIRGCDVAIDLAADPASLAGDAAVNHEIVRKMGLSVETLHDADAVGRAAGRWSGAAVIVDALLGTGFSGEVREPLASVIEHINQAGGTSPGERGPLVVAIDVPSGLDADTGTAAGPVVRAHHTITFLAEKTGYQNATARGCLGRVWVADIGAPTELILRRLGFY